MAEADGVITKEEKEILRKASRELSNHQDLKTWEQASQSPADLAQTAKNISISDRSLTAKLAYMVASAAEDERGVSVNTAELETFDLLVKTLELSELERDNAIRDATEELSRKTSFWEILAIALGGTLGEETIAEMRAKMDNT